MKDADDEERERNKGKWARMLSMIDNFFTLFEIIQFWVHYFNEYRVNIVIAETLSKKRQYPRFPHIKVILIFEHLVVQLIQNF